MIKAEKELIIDINLLGYNFLDLDDINRQKSIDINVIDCILRYIPKLFQEHTGTGIIACQCLLKSNTNFDPFVLIKLFENKELNFSIKSSIGFVIADANTKDISNWLKKQLSDKNFSLEKCSLINALPRKGGFKSNTELIEFVKGIFDNYINNEDILKIFKKHGTYEDVIFLKNKLSTVNKPLQRKVQKVIDLLSLSTL